MIIVSGWRAGLVIGVIVPPPKIQHEQSRWNKKFGSGGSNMLVGSPISHISPASRCTSALVIPPIKNSATCTGSAAPTPAPPPPGPAPFRGVAPPLPLAQDVPAHPLPGLRQRQRLGQQRLGLEHLHPAGPHRLGEHVMLGLGPRHPQHIIEKQLLRIRRRQPRMLQPRPVHQHLTQLADLRIHPERHCDHLVSCGPDAARRRTAFWIADTTTMDSATARQMNHCRTSRLVVFRNVWSGPKTVVSSSVRMDTPGAMTNLASENVSRLNAVRCSSLVSMKKNRAYSENVTTPMVCAIACVCACSAQLMTPSVPTPMTSPTEMSQAN